MIDISKLLSDPQKYANSLSTAEFVEMLEMLSDAYYNTGEPLVEDITYDILYDILKERDPSNSFFKEVGAKIKVNRKKVELKYPMGSLTKIKPNEGDLEIWLKKFKGPSNSKIFFFEESKFLFELWASLEIKEKKFKFVDSIFFL